MWHLVVVILRIFLRINWPNLHSVLHFYFYGAILRIARYFYGKLSVCLSVRLWRWGIVTTKVGNLQKQFHGQLALCRPQIMVLFQRKHPEILSRSDPPPVDLSVADIRWQIAHCSGMVRDSAMVTMGSFIIGNHHLSFQWYHLWPSTTFPSLKWWSLVHPSWYVEFQMAISSQRITDPLCVSF